MAALKPEHVTWTQHHWDSLTEGKKWHVPRSGLTFQRQGDMLVLVDGYDQNDTGKLADITAITVHFEAIGVEVVLPVSHIITMDGPFMPVDGKLRLQ